jgi:predicted RecB family nuclease
MNSNDATIAGELGWILGLDESTAAAIVGAGVRSLEELAYSPEESLLENVVIERKIIPQIRERARELLLLGRMIDNL